MKSSKSQVFVSLFISFFAIACVGCENQNGNSGSESRSSQQSSSVSYPNDPTQVSQFQCSEDVAAAKSQLVSAVQQVNREIQAGSGDLAPAPSVPTLVELRRTIMNAERISSDYRCKQSAAREGLDLYIQQSQQVFQIGTQAQKNRIELTRQLGESAKLPPNLFNY